MSIESIGLGGNVFDLVLRAGLVARLVLLILIGFSVASWAIIIHKWRLMQRIKRETRLFRELFADSENLSIVYAATRQFHVSPLARIFAAGYAELRPHLNTRMPMRGHDGSSDALNGESPNNPEPLQIGRFRRVLTQTASEEGVWLERHLSFLATTGSTTPFIGLFGTVWGIMNAFHGIGLRGSATLATVAPGISEALIATAAGLAVAIPAVMAYNHFVSKIRVQAAEMENFSTEFVSYAERELVKRT